MSIRTLSSLSPLAFALSLMVGTPAAPRAQATSRTVAQSASGVVSGAAGERRSRLIAAIDSIAQGALQSGRIPGLSVAVVKGRDTLVLKGYGLAHLGNVAATERTVYRIGSITKQFTAAAILRLAERGKLSLDDELTKFFPGYPVRGNRVTIRHLLNHTSGIRSYTEMGPRWERIRQLDMSPDSMIAFFREEPFDFAPGTRYRYNNSGYFLLGRIIEKASGVSYATYLRHEFFAPLGLAGTSYCDSRSVGRHHAQGYTLTGDTLVNAEPLSMTQPYSGGALCSTVGDLVAWTRALHGGKVVSAESLRRMTTPEALADGKALDYGYGLAVGALDGRRWVAHSGGINGFITYLSHYPHDTLTIAVLTNSDRSKPDAIEQKIARRVLGLPEPAPKDLPLAAEERRRFVGSYSLTMPGSAQPPRTLRIFEQDGALLGQVDRNEPTRMLYQGDNAFRPEAASAQVLTFKLEGGRAKRFSIASPDGTMEGVRLEEGSGGANKVSFDPSTSGALYDELTRMDSVLFDAAYVTCDAQKIDSLLTEDVEFYHDQTGFHSGQQVREDFRRFTESCPRHRGMSRKLVDGSLRVYPVKDYGAVQMGVHRFVEDGAAKSTIARFVTLWQRTDGGWRAARVLSLDHRTEGSR